MTDKSVKPKNFPVGINSLIQVLQASKANLGPGQQYGIFVATGCISCDNPIAADYEVIVMANTSATFGLEPGYIYSLQGKLIAPNDGTTPVFQYYPDLHRLVCKAEDLIGETITKTFIHSYGVVSVVEKDIKYNSGVAENILNVIMGHNDWDLDLKGLRQFNIRYQVPGKRNLINAQQLFEPKREFMIDGYVSGWDLDGHMPIVEVIALTLITGPSNRPLNSQPSSVNNSPTRPGRQFVKFSGPVDRKGSTSGVGNPSGDAISPQPMSMPGQPEEEGSPDGSPAKRSGRPSLNAIGKKKRIE